MRKDMDRLLVQRPRIEDYGDNKASYRRMNFNLRDLEVYEDEDGNKVVDLDDGGRHGAISRGRGTKILNENLAPLKRYLESQINRPWDKVYSEIRENISFDSAVQLHILQHLFQYVEKDCFEDENKAVRYNRGYRGYTELMDGTMYVHPRTGLFLKYKRKKRPPKVQETRVVQVSERVFYVKLDKLWFEIEYNYPVVPTHFYYSFGHPDRLASTAAHLYWDGSRHVDVKITYTKRQLPKRVLKEHDLKNAA